MVLESDEDNDYVSDFGDEFSECSSSRQESDDREFHPPKQIFKTFQLCASCKNAFISKMLVYINVLLAFLFSFPMVPKSLKSIHNFLNYKQLNTTKVKNDASHEINSGETEKKLRVERVKSSCLLVRFA